MRAFLGDRLTLARRFWLDCLLVYQIGLCLPSHFRDLRSQDCSLEGFLLSPTVGSPPHECVAWRALSWYHIQTPMLNPALLLWPFPVPRAHYLALGWISHQVWTWQDPVRPGGWSSPTSHLCTNPSEQAPGTPTLPGRKLWLHPWTVLNRAAWLSGIQGLMDLPPGFSLGENSMTESSGVRDRSLTRWEERIYSCKLSSVLRSSVHGIQAPLPKWITTKTKTKKKSKVLFHCHLTTSWVHWTNATS